VRASPGLLTHSKRLLTLSTLYNLSTLRPALKPLGLPAASRLRGRAQEGEYPGQPPLPLGTLLAGRLHSRAPARPPPGRAPPRQPGMHRGAPTQAAQACSKIRACTEAAGLVGRPPRMPSPTRRSPCRCEQRGGGAGGRGGGVGWGGGGHMPAHGMGLQTLSSPRRSVQVLVSKRAQGPQNVTDLAANLRPPL
jgi:hypothetical protein